MPNNNVKPAQTLTANVERDGRVERIDAEPAYMSQVFEVPEELTDAETKKWNEIIKILRGMDACPVSDADKDTLINYCKCWVRFINADKLYQGNPDDKENYKQMMDNAKLLAKLKSDLMLDVVSRCRVGAARVGKRIKENPFEALLNRQKD